MSRPRNNNQCTAPHCQQPARTRQLCSTHYKRQLKGLLLDIPIGQLPRQRRQQPCTIPHCNRTAIARHLCDYHYLRWRRGQPIDTGQPPPIQTRSCEHANCDAPHHALGLCRRHYLAEWTRAQRGR